jgi:hypothetical protein
MGLLNQELNDLQLQKQELIKKLTTTPSDLSLLSQIAAFEAKIRELNAQLVSNNVDYQKFVTYKSVQKVKSYNRGEWRIIYGRLLEDYRDAKTIMQLCSDLKKLMREEK